MEFPLENELAFQNIMLRFWEPDAEAVCGWCGWWDSGDDEQDSDACTDLPEQSRRWHTQPACSAEALFAICLVQLCPSDLLEP